MHGDTLCTDDVEYQKFRLYARNAQNQARFLAQPLAARRAQLRGLRAESEAAKQGKSAEIMDVNQQAVENALEDGRLRAPHSRPHPSPGAPCARDRWS